jgi:hypothetical protein
MSPVACTSPRTRVSAVIYSVAQFQHRPGVDVALSHCFGSFLLLVITRLMTTLRLRRSIE